MKTPQITQSATFQPSLKEKIDEINTWENFHLWNDIFNQEGVSLKESVQNAINDVLENLDINESNYPTYLQENNDFWNDQNQNGHYFCDLISEWADSQVDIYYYNIRKNSCNFADFEDDFALNYGGDCISRMIQDGGVPKLLQGIQYEAYHQFASTVVDLIKE